MSDLLWWVILFLVVFASGAAGGYMAMSVITGTLRGFGNFSSRMAGHPMARFIPWGVRGGGNVLDD